MVGASLLCDFLRLRQRHIRSGFVDLVSCYIFLVFWVAGLVANLLVLISSFDCALWKAEAASAAPHPEPSTQARSMLMKLDTRAAAPPPFSLGVLLGRLHDAKSVGLELMRSFAALSKLAKAPRLLGAKGPMEDWGTLC